MRASIVVAARNEGKAVARTVEACVKTGGAIDYEIVVVDDASVDGSVDGHFTQFPNVQVVRHERALGASAAKSAGAERARGDVLVFLDGHTKPASGALLRLVHGVERLEGEAIITPAVAALDVGRWQNDLSQTGHGYAFDLEQFECRWLGLAELQRSDGLPLYESPGLIGCAFAISRTLYERLWGFDPHMRSWGVEDLDLALKAWLGGARVLHDPDTVVGHQFRTRFDNYVVPVEDVLVNQLRVARKHFTHSVWEEWLARVRARTERDTNGRPEGIWAQAWHGFESDRASVEQERAYLQALRVHDEFWYARRFDLPWPRLHTAGAPNGAGAGAPVPVAQAGTPVALGPSPSPAPCRFTINGPANVPGFAQYQYEIALPAGKTATNIQWQSDKASATFEGATNQARVTVNFAAGLADFITLKATFLLDGVAECATIQIAMVRVQVGPRVFNNPGLPSNVALAYAFLVNPPAGGPHWEISHVPGSDVAAFTFNGHAQAEEPGNLLRSSNAAANPAAFTASTTVKLTAPPERPAALQRIEVGYLQGGFDAGNAQYGAAPHVHQRTVTVPTTTTVDWLTFVRSNNDLWPWYDANSRDRGTGSGTWARTLTMADSPSTVFPTQLNPNAGNTDAMTAGHDTLAFEIRFAARTLDNALGANALYFDHGHSTWAANFVFPLAAPAVSIVTFPGGTNWILPAKPRALEVNVVPTIINHVTGLNHGRGYVQPFLQWVPAKYIGYTPDITSDDFWDSHEVSVVLVDAVEGDRIEEGTIRTHVVRRLNARASRDEETYELPDLWFSPDPEERLTVQAGDTLVLYIGPTRPIVAERITPPVEESPLVRQLEQIVSLRRGEGGTDALRDASLHADPGVARYSLKRLIADPQIQVADTHIAQVRQARDDESGDPLVRLLAADLMFQREGKTPESDEPYQWLQDAVAQSTAPDWTAIEPFVRRLVSIDRRRGETAAFLSRLATDEQVGEPVRIAAYSGLEPLVYEVSPQESEQIVDACFQMLHSANATIRQAGAHLLYNFSVRGGPGPLEGLATRVTEALRSAQREEADEQVRARFERLTELLSRPADG
jgi:glycosyltransferase involved in cell wall biosynthesis